MRDIAKALASAPPRPGTTDALPTLTGTLGCVLFFAALGESTGDRAYVDAAAALLDEAIERASEQSHPVISLYGIPVGVGWVDAVAAARLGGAPDDESDVDLFVSNALNHDAWPGALDLVHGLAGVGVYCLARLPRARAHANLERIVRHLANAAEEDRDGVLWRYVPVPDALFVFNEHRPEGHVNLGFAHGVPGIVAFLAAATAAGVDGARDLLRGSAWWLDAQRRPAGSESAFATYVFPDRTAEGAKLAWCYGDPGVAVALLAAGDALGDRYLVDQARDVAIGCAEQSGDVEGATLCHGSAGLGHMFNRLGQALQEERLLDLARRWFGVTLSRDLPRLTVVDRERTKMLARAGSAIAVDAGYGLLFGAAGVGLALTAAVSDREPWWDAALFARSPGSWAPAELR